MIRNSKVLDFSGISLFVGIDVHKKSWNVSIRSSEIHYKTFSMNPNPEQLVHHLKENYPHGSYHCVYEAGFSGFWTCRTLNELGADCIVVHVPDIPTQDKERRNKTDARDSSKLAKMLCGGLLKGISIPSLEQESNRGLIRVRKQLVKDRTRTKNRIKSVLNFVGIENLYSGWGKKMLAWLAALQLHPSTRITLDTHLQQLQAISQQIRDLDKQIRKLSQSPALKEDISNLTSIPSVGLGSAMVFLTEIGNISRFETRNEFCSFLGLIPNTYSSGEKERIGGLTNRANHGLRATLVECAWVLVRYDPAMTLRFEELCKRMPKQKAIIRISRRLANRIRYILIHKCQYQIGVVA